jgi:hypothetical protein
MKRDESVEVNSSSPSVAQTGRKESKHGEGFQPFDYSKVNFSRFQGGSRASTNIKTEEKPKVSRKSTNLMAKQAALRMTHFTLSALI